ncbi:MAG: hypothetical protein IJZ39_12315 [Oscillospiraceae bacterium]|nr:hypothetical protein [Oscillospiraceae bacterium]
MNTYYEIRMTPEQRRTLIELSNMGLIEWCSTWEAVPNDPRRTAYEQAVALLEDAEEHPNIEDVYLYEAEHSGFTAGEKVLLECEMLGSADYVSTVAIHHLTASPGEVIMVSNKLIYHKD